MESVLSAAIYGLGGLPVLVQDARERRSNGDVEKAMEGFFNSLLVQMSRQA